MEQEIKVGMKIPEDKEAKVQYLRDRCFAGTCDYHQCPLYSEHGYCGGAAWKKLTDEELDELIKKWEAFDSEQALKKFLDHNKYMSITASPAETVFNREKVANLLYIIYQNVSPHLSAEGVAARNYCFHELGKELFGEGDMPAWMRR